jgi:hypothetical protein
MEKISGTTKNQTISEFGASTRFKGSKTIYMQLEEEKKRKDENNMHK